MEEPEEPQATPSEGAPVGAEGSQVGQMEARQGGNIGDAENVPEGPPQSTLGINRDDLLEFVELSDRKAALNEMLKRNAEKLAAVERRLLDQFADLDEGGGSIRLPSLGRTVYVHRQLWANARGGDRGRAAEALEAADLGDFVEPSFNTNTVSAYFRELDQNDEEPPAILADAFDVYEKFSVRSVRS